MAIHHLLFFRLLSAVVVQNLIQGIFSYSNSLLCVYYHLMVKNAQIEANLKFLRIKRLLVPLQGLFIGLKSPILVTLEVREELLQTGNSTDVSNQLQHKA